MVIFTVRYRTSKTRNVNIPSKLPRSAANVIKLLKVSADGLKTKTPELKQSGQPTSGAADSSSRSNSSSQFWITLK